MVFPILCLRSFGCVSAKHCCGASVVSGRRLIDNEFKPQTRNERHNRHDPSSRIYRPSGWSGIAGSTGFVGLRISLSAIFGRTRTSGKLNAPCVDLQSASRRSKKHYEFSQYQFCNDSQSTKRRIQLCSECCSGKSCCGNSHGRHSTIEMVASRSDGTAGGVFDLQPQAVSGLHKILLGPNSVQRAVSFR